MIPFWCPNHLLGSHLASQVEAVSRVDVREAIGVFPFVFC